MGDRTCVGAPVLPEPESGGASFVLSPDTPLRPRLALLTRLRPGLGVSGRENPASSLDFRDFMRCHSRPRALALVVVAAFCVASVQPVLAADPERERLDQTEQEKNQKKAELEEAQRTDEQLTAAPDQAGRRVNG